MRKAASAWDHFQCLRTVILVLATGNMRTLLILAFLILLVTSAFPKGEVFFATVTSVIDGNVFEITSEDKLVQRLSLAGIDCPEGGQPYFENAKTLLEKLILNKQVRVQIEGKNRWGHYLAIVTVVKTGLDPRLELLEQGLAWTAEKAPAPELEAIRVNAEGKSRGLWKDENPVAPWIYRRQQSMLQAKSS
jgi:micrococcal nuclease